MDFRARCWQVTGLVAAVASWLIVDLRDAAACASCASGDPTMTAMGAEQPYAGRVRVGALALRRGERQDDGLRVDEEQLVMLASWSTGPSFSLALALPAVRRSASMTEMSGQAFGLGEVDLRAGWVVWRDRGFAPGHLVRLQAGAVAPSWLSASGELPVSDEWIPDGGFAGLVGASYLWTHGQVSSYVSGTLRLPVDDPQHPVVVASDYLQWQSSRGVALRLGVDGRIERSAHGATDTPVASLARHTHPGATSDGEMTMTHAVLMVGPEIAWSVGEDLVLGLGLRAPAWQSTAPTREGWSGSLVMTMDL